MARFGLRLETGGSTPAQIAERSRQAESLGYESVWLPEGTTWDAISLLTFIAGATTRIRLATGVLPVFYRSPALFAMSGHTLASISNNRFVLGIGSGHPAAISDHHGVTYERPFARLRETVDIVRRMLSQAKVDFQGQVFSLKNASLGASATGLDIPIYISALRPQMLELAGEIADGVVMNWASLDFLDVALEHLHRGARRAGRDPDQVDVACYVRTGVGDTDSLRDALRRRIAFSCSMPYYMEQFAFMGFEKEAHASAEAWASGDRNTAAEVISEPMQDAIGVIGPPEACRAKIEAMLARGLDLPVIAPFTEDGFEPTMRAFSS